MREANKDGKTEQDPADTIWQLTKLRFSRGFPRFVPGKHIEIHYDRLLLGPPPLYLHLPVFCDL